MNARTRIGCAARATMIHDGLSEMAFPWVEGITASGGSVRRAYRGSRRPALGAVAWRVARRPDHSSGGRVMPHNEVFGERLRELLAARGESYRRLAARVHHGKSYLQELAVGKKMPTPETAMRLDEALDAGGALVAALPADSVLADADAQTASLLTWLADDAASIGELLTGLGEKTEVLAVDYLGQRGPVLAARARELRAVTWDVVHRARGPRHLRDAVVALGYQSGVLAYVALDAGSPDSAMKHATLAWRAADRVGSDQLRAWARGTQSLVCRFEGDYRLALAYAEDGLRYATSGTAEARLQCGIGQCKANMADAPAARRALRSAATAFERQRGVDDVSGLFSFSRAKLAYYSGSALIWLPGSRDNQQARRQAHAAIGLWEQAGRQRSVADEALAHVYAATASLAVGELDAAIVDLEPILGLPPERRISWIRKRLDRVSRMLAAPSYLGNRVAAETLERIGAY